MRHELSRDTRPMQLLLSTVAQVLRPDGVAVPLGPRDAALLAWLVLEGPTPRAQLAALLWPESPPEAARNTLRQRLFQLRKLLGADVVSGQQNLQLAAGVGHDLAGGHELLADVNLDLGGDYAAWLAQQRAQRVDAHLSMRQAEAEQLERAGEFEAALPHAQALLRLAPLSEAAHRRVMRLHYLAGDRAAALLAFDACEQVLKNEVGTRPSTETLGLLRAIEARPRIARDREVRRQRADVQAAAANTAFARERFNEAMNAYNQAVTEVPTHVLAWCFRMRPGVLLQGGPALARKEAAVSTDAVEGSAAAGLGLAGGAVTNTLEALRAAHPSVPEEAWAPTQIAHD